MTHPFTRRRFLAATTAAVWSTCRPAGAGERPAQPSPTLDIHVHLFGIGDGPSGCRLSKEAAEGPAFRFLSQKLRLRERAKTLDEAYVLALAEQLDQSGLQKALVLAQDAVYDRHGKPDWQRTTFYVPNDYLLDVVARYPRKMLACVSVNPQRADAIAELERSAGRGAKAVKIHPPTQGVDLSDRKHGRFFRRCAELKLVVLVHTGHEHTAPVVDAGLANPRKLELALGEGCSVVACHCGTGWPQDQPDMLPDFLAMLRKHKNLWGDTAVLGSAGRVRDCLRLLADAGATDRLLHGSDFPFPAVPLAFAGRLGLREAAGLQAIENSLRQDLALKEALGIGRAPAERAYRLISTYSAGRRS